MWTKGTDNLYHHRSSISLSRHSNLQDFIVWHSCGGYAIVQQLSRIEDEVVILQQMYRNTQIYSVCPNCWTLFESSYECRNSFVHYREAERQRKEQEIARQKAEQERVRQQREALVAAKLAEGKPEVRPQRLVTLLDVGLNEETTYYLIRGRVVSWHGQLFNEDQDPIPELPDGVFPLRTGTSGGVELIGERLIGLFVGDEVTTCTDSGYVTYRITKVESLIESTQDQNPSCRVTKDDSDLPTYSGRGKVEGQDSATIDGSRYVGFLARDTGEWGSFPMHDDYGDESDAEGKDYQEWSD